MRRLIEQLLDLSRLDAHSVTIDPQPLVLRQVLEEVAEATAPGDGRDRRRSTAWR